MRKKLGLFLIAALIVFLLPCNCYAASSKESEETIYPMGAIPDKMVIDDPLYNSSKSNNRGIVKSVNLPSKYDAREYGFVTSVKDQDSFGSCWAFAATAAMESSLIKSGLADSTIDLSELHMIYFMYSENIDEKNRISQDRNYVSDDDLGTPTTNFSLMADAGGKLSSVGWQMTNGVIPYEDNGDDYNLCVANSNYKIGQDKCFSDKLCVKNVLISNFNEDNIDNVKKLIYEHGGVAADFYCDQTTTTSGESQYFNYVDGTKTYYCPIGSNNSGTHAIEVIGWNDEYPKENFKFTPPKDGAWLVKNSWGKNSRQDGYIYLSYYDIGMYAKAVAYEFETSTPNDCIYQYDGSDNMNYVYGNNAGGDLYALALFTADSVDEGGIETIEKVGVGLKANSTCRISILLEPVIDKGELVSYKEKAVTTCNTTYAGYYLQELSEPVTVEQGTTFAICIKLESGSEVYATLDKTTTTRGETGYKESISDDQYYIGYSLSSLSKPDGHSLVIKAISNTKKYSDVTSIALDKTEVELDWSKEDKKSIKLKAGLEPGNAYPSVKWKSSNENVATVIPSEDGRTAVVEAHLDGECVITAVSYDKTKTASCTVKVHNADEDSYIVKTHKSGDLYWNINEDGVLSIYGSGDYRETYEIEENFKGAPWLEYSESITSAEVSVTNITNARWMFYCCRNLETVSFSGSDTSNMLYAPQMFYGCRNLSSIDFTDFSMLNCKNINAMFFGCWNLKKLDFGNVSFADNISASGWLEECYELESIIVPPNISSEMDIYVNDAYYYWKDQDNEKCTSIIPKLNNSMIYRKYRFLDIAYGSEVRLINENIEYGQKLSTLSFDEVSFVEKGTSTEVAGRLKWKYPDHKPDVTDITAEWVFVPDDNMRDRVEGTISINVNRAVPVISIMPSVDGIVYNPKVSLGNIDITGGSVNVEGTWSWKDDSIIPVVNNNGYTAVFTPIDEERYSPRECTVSVNVEKATPILITKPMTTNIAIGDMLPESQLYDGVVKHDVSDDSELAGMFKWLNTKIQPTFEDSEITEYDVVWMPDNSDNYNGINTKVTVRVDKITNAPGKPLDQMNVQYEIGKVEQIKLNDNWVWNDEDSTKDLEVGITKFAVANYIGEDVNKYKIATVTVAITRQECIHSNLIENMIFAVSASCEQNGNIQYYKCKECGKCFSDVAGTVQIDESDVVIEKSGHTLTSPFIENEVSATCEKDGCYDEVVYCSVCGEEISRTTVKVDAYGHNYKEVIGSAKAATCTQSGKEADKKCSACGDVIKGKVIGALGHNWGEWTVKTPATEISEGVEERDCERNLSHTETRVIPKLSHIHALVKVESKTASCTETGNAEYWKCSGCDRVFADECGKIEIDVENTIIAKIEHILTSAVNENEIKATCEKDGSYEDVVYCSVCGEEISRTTVKVDAYGHNYKEVIGSAKAATCTQSGKEADKKCSVCGDVIEGKVIDALGHDWSEWTVKTPATETSEGVEERVCNNDSTHIETRKITKVDITPAADDKDNQSTIIKPPTDEIATTTTESAVELLQTIDEITLVNENTNRIESSNSDFIIISSEDGDNTLEYKPLSEVSDKTVIIPENKTIEGVTYKVTEIADEAFAGNKNIEKVVISNNIEIIGDGAFSGCTNLKTVTIPTSVKEIGEAAFEGCKNLKTVDISSGVTEIGDRSFANCSSLTKITIPAKVKKLGKNIFRNNKKLKTIIIKSTKIKSIGKGSFKNINKKAVIYVPKSLTKKQLTKYKKMIKKAGVAKSVKIKKK